eukprot:scaffold98_cov248-Ochromonas_danica.AAC.27
MQVEKSTLFSIAPTHPYDFYTTSLRNPQATIRQMGVPVDLEVREMEVNTEEINTDNKSVQVCFGDDTQFYKLIEEMKLRRKGNTNGEGKSGAGEVTNISSTVQTESRSTQLAEDIAANAGSVGSSTLSAFLQRTSSLCEAILSEERQNELGDRGVGSESKTDTRGLLEPSSSWTTMGQDRGKGENELIRSRLTTAVRFSCLQPHILLAVHPYPLREEDAELDLRANKGLISLWDVIASPGCPYLLLECSSQPSCATFSNAQSHLVVAGTYDGALHLWDLREASSLHQDKDSLDLKITKGIRKPSYSTYLCLSISTDTDEFGDEVQHTAGVVQIEPLGEVSYGDRSLGASSSQFVSLDEKGTLVFWVASEAPSRVGETENLKRSPWGRVLLNATKQVNTQYLLNHDLRTDSTSISSSNKNLLWLQTDYSVTSLLLPEVICCPVVGDSATVLVGMWKGELVKAMRIGEPAAPRVLQRTTESGFAHITCISVRSTPLRSNRSTTDTPSTTNSSQKDEPPLILVGREDGTVDLFQLDILFPLLTWDIATICNDNRGKANNVNNVKSNQIALVRWIEIRGQPDVSFAVLTDRGTLLKFDLLKNLYRPEQIESIEWKGKIRPSEVDLSILQSRLDACRIAVCNRKDTSLSLKFRKLNTPAWFRKENDECNNEKNLREKLAHAISPILMAGSKNSVERSDRNENKK